MQLASMEALSIVLERSPLRGRLLSNCFLDEDEQKLFSPYTPAELTQAFEKTCGQIPSKESLALVMEPHPSHVQVVVDCIVLRVRFLNESGQRDKFIVLQLASGC